MALKNGKKLPIFYLEELENSAEKDGIIMLILI
jgi:hypothetical protein